SCFPPACLPLIASYLLSFFCASSVDHRVLHSFPTRRSSDLFEVFYLKGGMKAWSEHMEPVKVGDLNNGGELYQFVQIAHFHRLRSEEHTSELQSRFDLVCRLLLEKKNELRTTYVATCMRLRD